MPKESTLKKGCAELIRQRGGFARSIPQGIHTAGMGDLVAVYRGYGIVIETKLPGKEKTLTPLQAETLRKVRAAGGIGVVITTRQQVRDLLNKIDSIKDRKDK